MVCLVDYNYDIVGYIFVVMVVNIFDNSDCIGVVDSEVFIGNVVEVVFVFCCFIEYCVFDNDGFFGDDLGVFWWLYN